MKNITEKWLKNRLHLLNAMALEREANLTPRRLTDVKRGKAKLTDPELDTLTWVLKSAFTIGDE